MTLPAAADFLEELLRIPSVSGEESEAARWLVARMRAIGFDEAFIDRAGSPVGIAGRGDRVLMLLGHIDTVPGEIPVRRENGRLYGRGSVDAKGPLAAFTLAAALAPRRDGWKTVVIGAVEEEAATARGAREAAGAWRPEACVIGEPSGWERLCVGYKGRLLVDYRLERPLGHTAGPERGACEIAVDFWNAVKAHADHVNRNARGLFDQLSPSLRSIRSRQDGLTEIVEARLGLRLPSSLRAADVEVVMTGLAGPARLEFAGREEAFRATKSNPLARAFLGAIRAEGGDPGFIVKTGTSDMNVVGPVWGCPILAYGPGDSRLDHTPDEHILIEELERSVRVLTDVIGAIGS